MYGVGECVGVLQQERLGAIAVVHVEVKDGDALPVPHAPLCHEFGGHGQIAKDAEARGSLALGVVLRPRQIYRREGLAPRQRLEGRERAARHELGQRREVRAWLAPGRLWAIPTVEHCCEVRLAMDQGELFSGSWPWGNSANRNTIRIGKLANARGGVHVPDPLGWMGRPEVPIRELWGVDVDHFTGQRRVWVIHKNLLVLRGLGSGSMRGERPRAR